MASSLKRVTIIISNDLDLHILDYFKTKNRWPVDKTVEVALRELFEKK